MKFSSSQFSWNYIIYLPMFRLDTVGHPQGEHLAETLEDKIQLKLKRRELYYIIASSTDSTVKCPFVISDCFYFQARSYSCSAYSGPSLSFFNEVRTTLHRTSSQSLLASNHIFLNHLMCKCYCMLCVCVSVCSRSVLTFSPSLPPTFIFEHVLTNQSSPLSNFSTYCTLRFLLLEDLLFLKWLKLVYVLVL